MSSQTHFNQRCLERGITKTDPNQLFTSIKHAIENNTGLVDKVLVRPNGTYWRFRCEDGIFYAITGNSDPRPRTVITQQMMRSKKWAHKQEKRGRRRGSP